MYVQIEIPRSALTVSDVYRLYPACPTSSTVGTVLAEFTYLGDYIPDGLRYWQIDLTGDTDSETYITQELDGGNNVMLYVCVDQEIDLVVAGVWPSESQRSTWIEDDPGTGRYAGIGHNTTSKLMVFDDFEMGELRTSTEVCETCFCMCDLIPMPQHLTGTFLHTSVAGATRMSCLEGITWTMDFVPGLSSPTWYGEAEVTTVEDTPVTQTVKFTLTCTSPAWSLSITVYEGETEVDAACFRSAYYGGTPSTSVTARWEDDDPAPLYASTCDPLSLVYGPWDVDALVDLECDWCYERSTPLIPCLINPGGDIGGPACQGQFWIFITETP